MIRFTENQNFWLKGLDFTCVSPWNDRYGKLRAGTAVSKRHILCSKHFPLTIGTRISFVGANGDVSYYTIKAVKALDDRDIVVGLLDYELTPDIHPAKVLPAQFGEWLQAGSSWPVVTFNQNKEAILSEAVCRRDDNFNDFTLINHKSESVIWKKLGGNIINGDSGGAAFLIYNGKPILLWCLSVGGVGYGSFIHRSIAPIQHAMDNLCPGYRLELFDFPSAE